MRRLAWVSALAALACAPKPDPERIKLLRHLRDARPAARIVAIQQLAPHANREETVAIARAAEDMTSDVRKAVALALAKSDAENAEDLIAPLLRDPSDEVRAAAVASLAQRGGPRAISYIAHAYASGGPLMRAAVEVTGPEILDQAVKVEAQQLTAKRERRRKDSHELIRSDALADLGTNGTPAAIAELTTRLVDASPATAAAACRGLAEAGATEQLPYVLQALKGNRPPVTQSCAYAVAILDPTHAADLLAPLVKAADPGTASMLLGLLSSIKLTAPAYEALCQTALETKDGATAARAAELVGVQCSQPSEPHPQTWGQGDVFRVMAALGRKDPALLMQAREALGGNDVKLSAAAATYLGACGAPADAALLQGTVTAELAALDAARAQIAQTVEAKREQVIQSKEQEDQQWRAVLGAKYDEIKKLRQPLRDKLLEKLGRSMGPDVPDEFEVRPGSVDLISAAAVAAMRQGADSAVLATTLLAEKELRLRLLAVEMANSIGPAGEEVRKLARSDEDPVIQRAQAMHDLQTGDEAAIARVGNLVDSARPEERRELAQALVPLASKATSLLISLAHGGDEAVPAAVAALSHASGQEVDRALIQQLGDQKGLGATEAVEALRGRQGADIDTALTHAAVHPNPQVREAALRALAARHSCAAASVLRVLSDDYVGSVRTAAAELAKACATPK